MSQDGHIEKNIPSTELFPIHHLDELEFFPGDFVSPASELPLSETYGVVESVDHADRTMMVKWMKPYTVGKTNRFVCLGLNWVHTLLFTGFFLHSILNPYFDMQSPWWLIP